jgi:hypothetical protein
LTCTGTVGTRSCYGKTYRVYFRTAMPALVGALIVFTVVTFSYISDVRPQMLQVRWPLSRVGTETCMQEI